MAKKLTELLREAVAKSRTEEGRRELREQRERMETEALQTAQKAAQAAPAPPESAEDAQAAPGGPQAVEGPPEVRPERRIDPILPVVVGAVKEAPEREAGRLAFGGIIEERKSLPAQLPLLPRPEGPRVPILELSDYRGVPTMARGRGAPLDLRLAVGACVLTPHVARSARGRLAVTVRELRDFLFPNGWERRRDWPRIRDALKRARDYVLPVPNSAIFSGGSDALGCWYPFALRHDPGRAAALDDLILIDVELPPGAGHGPVIDRRELARLGVDSAPRFRAYIAAHSVAWRPGVTRRPHPRNRRFHIWSSNPGNYPVLTAEDRDRLAFGAADTVRSRTRAHKDKPWEDLPGVEILTRKASTPDGGRGWLVVPEAAAAAIRALAVQKADADGTLTVSGGLPPGPKSTRPVPLRRS